MAWRSKNACPDSGQTTDPGLLRALAHSIQPLPAKPTEAQAQQALAPLLKQIGQTTDVNALPALAQAVQALAAKLTARTGPWRPGFPVRGDHRFRWMTTTCSGRWRPGQQGCGRA